MQQNVSHYNIKSVTHVMSFFDLSLIYDPLCQKSSSLQHFMIQLWITASRHGGEKVHSH